MADFLQRLKQRKLVQWALAYLAAAWVVLQVLDLASGSYGWPRSVMHAAFGVLALGLVIVLVLAWYHGERGTQRISGIELLIIALVLAVGGAWLWRFGRPVPAATPAEVAAAVRSGASPRVATASHRASSAAPASSIATTSKSPAVAITAPPIPAKSVAVLPFENLSADKNNAYFADGIQDLILTKLADIGDLKVIARTSTMQYGSHPQNLTLVGKQLGVATILEGSVQKAGNQVLINVQLIDAKTDGHIWAQSYTRNLTNIFGVEGEVAAKVAAALNAKLTAAETARVTRVLTTNPQALTLYLKAQHDTDLMLASDSADQTYDLAENAVSLLKQAVALDPGFAAAWANLAMSELVSFNIASATGKEPVFPLDAETHARKALSLQPDLAAGHQALAFVYFVQRDLANALQEAQTAVRLAPSATFSAGLLAEVYQSELKWQLAYDVMHKAVRLDPRNVGNYDHAAIISMRLRRYADARQMLERGLAISPDDPALLDDMGDLLLTVGQPAAARVYFARLPDSADDKFSNLAYAWALSRNDAQALKAARRIPSFKNNPLMAGERVHAIGRYTQLSGNKADADAAFTQARSGIQAALQQHFRAKSRHAAADRAYLYSRLAMTEAESGHHDAALRAMDTMMDEVTSIHRSRPRGSTLLQAASGYFETKAEIMAQLGDAKGATDTLRQLFETEGTGGVISVPLLKLDPVWDPIRHDPSFQALLQKYATVTPGVAPAPATSR